MQYRVFGNTGISLSSLGFGCMRLPEVATGDQFHIDDDLAIPLLTRAVELGINYFDTAWGYCHGDSQRVVGRALKPFRNKVYISTKLPMWNINEPEDFWKYLMASLERLDTNYIDLYHFHAVNAAHWEKIKNFKLLDKMERARAMGLIRHISFSFHDDPQLLMEMVDTKAFDSLLCQYNLIDRANEKAMSYAKENGVGVVVMGPLGGGNIAQGGTAFLKKFNTDARTSAQLGFRFVLGNPAVTCAISGMSSIHELEENIASIENPGSSNWHRLAQTTDELQTLSTLYCTGCDYCEVCPRGIHPSSVFRAYNLKFVWGLDSAAQKILSKLGNDEATGSLPTECISCGACSKKCPQKLDIPAELSRTWAELNEMR